MAKNITYNEYVNHITGDNMKRDNAAAIVLLTVLICLIIGLATWFSISTYSDHKARLANQETINRVVVTYMKNDNPKLLQAILAPAPVKPRPSTH